MKIEHPYSDCEKCKNIEDCPHPDVDSFGNPIHPEVCKKSNKVSLKKRKYARDTNRDA